VTKRKQNTTTIATFIGQFPTERLCHLLAMAEDGKMHYMFHKRCLLGLLGTGSQAETAYQTAARMAGGKEAESAYHNLCYSWLGFDKGQQLRDKRLAKIVRAELDRREKLHLTVSIGHIKEPIKEPSYETTPSK